jgi:gliding motility-associated-like protein
MYNWQDGSVLPTYPVTAAGEYIVTISVDGCETADTINVSYLEVTSINLGNDTTLCWGDTLTLIANAPGADHLWSDNSATETLNVSQPGMYWVQVSLAACSAADSIVIEFSDPVFISLGPDTILCPGETIILDAETVGGEYLWQDNSQNDTYTVLQSGTYWVVVDVAGCKAADTVDVAYTAFPLVDLGSDTILCEGDVLEIQVSVPMATYVWQDNSTNEFFEITEAGSYSVTVSVGRCTTQDAIDISPAPSFIVDLGMDRTICNGESVLLDAGLTGELDYIWQDNSTAQTLLATDAGEYWLQITDDCGSSADTITVVVENCDCPMYVPNTFSPNGDGINDAFAPQAGCTITDFLLRIYDRDGGLLFETREPGGGWNGMVNEEVAQVGVYAFILRYTVKGEEAKQIAGDVTIIR